MNAPPPALARIGIVEDERIIALDLRNMLRNLGYEVVGMAANGNAAWELARDHHPDMMLMDINLEGDVSGTQAARRIHDEFHVPIIFLTAYAGDSTLTEAEACRPYGYLLKPFEFRELEATLRMALARRRAELVTELAEERLRMAMDVAELGVWEWERDSGRLEVVGKAEWMLGPRAEPIQEGMSAFLRRVHPEDRDALEAALRSGECVFQSVRVDTAEGLRWAEIHARAFDTSAPGTGRVVGVIRDVTESRAMEDRLRQAAVVFQTTTEGIVILDSRLQVVLVNQAFAAMMNAAGDELIGRHADDLPQLRHHARSFYEQLPGLSEATWRGESICSNGQGGHVVAWERVSAVNGSTGEPSYFVLTFADMSAIRAAEAQIHYLAYHDALTGLGNRHLLTEQLGIEIQRASRREKRLALMVLDLDCFKTINDSLGHEAGDRLLQEIAVRLRQILRRSDFVARLGGDEFVVLLPEIEHLEHSAVVASKLLRVVEQPINLGSTSVTVGCSIGIAFYPENAQTAESLISAADNAMYEAKQQGRNRYSYYAEDMAQRILRRLRIEQGLRQALSSNNGELWIEYQPLIDARTGATEGFEALARWQSPTLGRVRPDEFISVAEDTGLIAALGEWVLREACETGRRWQSEMQRPFYMAVNVSARQVCGGRFVATVAQVLEQTGFPAAQLELEMTESVMQTPEGARGTLPELHDMGLSIAIDDFGTGFSSMALLKSLQISRVKIDRSFIADLPGDAADLAIVEAVIALARSLNLRVTAEGVETPEQRRTLEALDCDSLQGFLFSQPLVPDRARSWLSAPGSVSGP